MNVAALLDVAIADVVADGIRAPSSHNTQPWRFTRQGDVLELFADRDRALPVNDPDDRELLLSCGTALTNIELSADRHGLATTVEIEAEASGRIATVQFSAGRESPTDATWQGIGRRFTWRGPFEDRPVPRDVVSALRAPGSGDGVWAMIVPDELRGPIAELVEQGDRRQWADPAWRRELAFWIRPSSSRDGLTVPALAAPVARWVAARMDLGARAGRRDAERTRDAPSLMAVGTTFDDRQAWVQCGRRLQRLLLTAARADLQAGYSNQPCQVPELRDEAERLLGRRHLQVLLRLGYPPKGRPRSSRRSVGDVLDRR